MIIGNCAICNEKKELTFEHVPPRAAFNNKLIFIQKGEHLVDKSSKIFGKKNRSHKGFGSYTLCKSCNNNTGSWYGKDYFDFAAQGMEIINKKESPSYIKGQYTIKPLNVLKQILSMFLSADKSGTLRDDKELSDFILNRESTNLPNRYKIFIYSNASKTKRMIGLTIAFDLKLGICKWSEINFQPFGFFLTIDSPPPNNRMVEITDFHELSYDSIYKITITTPYLHVSSPLIGIYD